LIESEFKPTMEETIEPVPIEKGIKLTKEDIRACTVSAILLSYTFFIRKFYKNTRLIFCSKFKNNKEQSQPQQKNQVSNFELK